eukprot:Clim_evm9s208 gene=Clim_evmTU9s208
MLTEKHLLGLLSGSVVLLILPQAIPFMIVVTVNTNDGLLLVAYRWLYFSVCNASNQCDSDTFSFHNDCTVDLDGQRVPFLDKDSCDIFRGSEYASFLAIGLMGGYLLLCFIGSVRCAPIHLLGLDASVFAIVSVVTATVLLGKVDYPENEVQDVINVGFYYYIFVSAYMALAGIMSLKCLIKQGYVSCCTGEHGPDTRVSSINREHVKKSSPSFEESSHSTPRYY